MQQKKPLHSLNRVQVALIRIRPRTKPARGLSSSIQRNLTQNTSLLNTNLFCKFCYPNTAVQRVPMKIIYSSEQRFIVLICAELIRVQIFI